MKTRDTITIRTLHVEGQIWQGQKCRHAYPLTREQQPATLAEAEQIAGDFAHLTHATVETETRTTERQIKRVRLAA